MLLSLSTLGLQSPSTSTFFNALPCALCPVPCAPALAKGHTGHAVAHDLRSLSSLAANTTNRASVGSVTTRELYTYAHLPSESFLYDMGTVEGAVCRGPVVQFWDSVDWVCIMPMVPLMPSVCYQTQDMIWRSGSQGRALLGCALVATLRWPAAHGSRINKENNPRGTPRAQEGCLPFKIQPKWLHNHALSGSPLWGRMKAAS